MTPEELEKLAARKYDPYDFAGRNAFVEDMTRAMVEARRQTKTPEEQEQEWKGAIRTAVFLGLIGGASYVWERWIHPFILSLPQVAQDALGWIAEKSAPLLVALVVAAIVWWAFRDLFKRRQ